MVQREECRIIEVTCLEAEAHRLRALGFARSSRASATSVKMIHSKADSDLLLHLLCLCVSRMIMFAHIDGGAQSASEVMASNGKSGVHIAVNRDNQPTGLSPAGAKNALKVIAGAKAALGLGGQKAQ
jgi:hypothetical protein